MIVYDGIKTDFLVSVENDSIATTIERNIYEKLGHRTGKSEFRSWENSLEYMYKVLNDHEIPDDSGIAIEYNLPQTSKRIDFLISGYDNADKSNVVIIELKQWDELTAVESQDAVVDAYTGGAVRRVVHPSYQAWSYAMMIRDYNKAVQDKEILLWPCSYLHNYRRKDNDPIDFPQYKDYLDESPAFTRGEVGKLRDFIKKCVITGDNAETIYTIDNGKIHPSKSLQNSIANMIKGNKEFYMLDDQKVVYEEIMEQSRACNRDNKKRTIIVTGGPGTGKTVVAVNLLAALTLDGQVAQYVSKNSAPRNVYLAKLKGEMRKSSVDNMFKSSGAYTEMEPNKINTIIVDEAHRLNEKSGLFNNLGENQIKEIIRSSICNVFFIDERQRVTINDIGSVNEIIKWAEEEGSEITRMELISQFRCDGSDGYLAWVDDVLDIRETANPDMREIDYDIRICDTPEQLRDLIFEHNCSSNRARILAGYCWNWIKSGKNDSNVHDIKIGDFEMSWNLGNTSTFAIDENSVEEVGCIHTSQGLEFDYVGVIFGEDMRYENGHVITDFTKRANTDQSLKGIKTLAKKDPQKANEIADEIIKNTYRTLMTRGMKGCYVYCVDKNLGDYLKSRLGV